MKKFKKRVIVAALTLGILTCAAPAVVFADGNYTAQLVIEASSDAGEFPKSGDPIRVSLYMQNAGWAQKDKGTGWAGGLISLTYNQDVLQYIGFTEEKIVSDVFDDITENHVDHGSTGEILWLGMNSQLANEVSFTNTKTKLAEVLFIVKEDLPQNLDGVLAFDCPEKLDFQFGDLDNFNSQVPGIEDAVITPVFQNKVKFDTTAPAVTLDGGNQTNFHYSPVKVEIKETNGIGSVTLNGEALHAPYAVAKSGTLVVKDKQGNTKIIEIMIDDAAYLAAKAAIEKLPEAIGYQDEALVTSARKATEAVIDKTAKGKLDIVRLKKAEEALKILQRERAALVQEIAGTKFNITLKEEDVAAVQGLRAKVDALAAKGAAFIETELQILTVAESKLTVLQNRSQSVHEAIAALPSADKVVFSNKPELENIKKQLAELTELGDVFTENELKKLDEVEAALQAIQADADQLKTEMETLPNAADRNSAALLNEVEKKITALKKRGYPVDESTMSQEAMERYTVLKEIVSPTKIPASTPTTDPAANDLQASFGAQTKSHTNLLGLAGLLCLCGVAAFTSYFIIKKRKKDL